MVALLLIIFFTAGSPGVTSAASINWYDYQEGVFAGKQEGKKIFIHFWAEWCSYCKTMEKETFRNSSVISYLNNNFVSIKVNSDKDTKTPAKYSVRGLPSNWFLTGEGEKISNLPGHIPADKFLQILKYIETDSYKNMNFKEFFNKTP